MRVEWFLPKPPVYNDLINLNRPDHAEFD